MELSLGGNALRTFTRSVTCLARVGSELVVQASASKLIFQTINSSRTAYQSVSYMPDFFDSYAVSPSTTAGGANREVQCSVLLKAICSIFRTPVSAVDRLTVVLPSPDAPKIQWTLECFSGVKKTYWITCHVEPDVHQLSIDRERYPSSFVVRPRDLARLLGNFQSTLQDITIIATDPSAVPSDSWDVIGGKVVEFRNNTDTALHTQLWVDPAEEFLQYTHSGEPVDVTFCVKELKAFLSFCEGCEVDILLCFEKAGEPILMAPKFGFDDASNSDCDATLVLCTMLASQLPEGSTPQCPTPTRVGSQAEHARTGTQTPVANQPSDNVNILSELSGIAVNISDVARERRVQDDGNPSCPSHPRNRSPCNMETNHLDKLQESAEMASDHCSKHHASNWLDEDDEDEEDEDDGGAFIPSTPPF
ncbi:unnamed protein product [Spirodela intermedia]|uniref:Uncharacterized protein n=1 Tax=Spirodela intermedia TaxID=51605 RepID=A0A7I8IZM2_SPIIN|nr:unnamed protein product [Spirodela intermedia]CAA6663435.1 unnamed protein product [Spirodela intermedia]